jgi:ABC-type transporter Mla subunit MlaD
MQKKGLFDEYNRYYFKTKNAQTFYIGMPLRFSGFEIGNISDMVLLDSADVKITIKIKKIYRKWITRDTKLIINRPLIGSPSIDIVTKSKVFILNDGDEIKNVFIKDDIDDIIAKLLPIVKKLQKIVDNIEIVTNKIASEDDGSIGKSIKNIEKFTNKLASDKGLLTLLTGDSNSTESLSDALKGTKDMIDGLNDIVEELNATALGVHKEFLPPFVNSAKSLDEIMLDIKRKLRRLNKVVNEISSSKSEIRRLKRDIRVNMKKTGRVIDKVDRVFRKSSKSKVELP